MADESLLCGIVTDVIAIPRIPVIYFSATISIRTLYIEYAEKV
jgi:ethanolamine utilization protein EutQ (cupin superfamily)